MKKKKATKKHFVYSSSGKNTSPNKDGIVDSHIYSKPDNNILYLVH